MRRLLPRETRSESKPAATAAGGLAESDAPGDVFEGHEDGPHPGVKGPDGVTGGMGDGGVE